MYSSFFSLLFTSFPTITRGSDKRARKLWTGNTRAVCYMKCVVQHRENGGLWRGELLLSFFFSLWVGIVLGFAEFVMGFY